jgi:DNA topoisomerase-2
MPRAKTMEIVCDALDIYSNEMIFFSRFHFKKMPPKMTSKAGATVKYGKMSQVDHILKRPDMYVGSVRSRESEEFVADPANDYHITKKSLSFSPAFLRIFIEPLSNAIDNVSRSRQGGTKCSKIKVNIDDMTGMTTVWNDGEIIPIEMNEEEKCYNHSMIFGQLLTSSNYDDEEERVDISGRNGLGIKVCNVFSTWFRVRACDPNLGKTFQQEWAENMKVTGPPKITASKAKTGFTEVSWLPDFNKLGMPKGYNRDLINLYCKFVVDTAMLTKINVSFNDVVIPVKTLASYAQLYSAEPIDESLTITHSGGSATCEILVTPSLDGYSSIAFSNGIFNPLGGVHVDAWTEAIFRPLVTKFNKKGKPQINITDVKRFFRLFVVASVINPEYDSQSKMRLESPKVVAEVKPAHITKIAKWSIAGMIQDIITSKEMMVLKKSEKKRTGFKKIDGFDRANNAGGAKSTECTLILCEGNSAKTYAVRGLSTGVFGKTGRDWFGILPLRGKVFNVREKNPAVIAKNAVVANIVQAIGLRYGVDYTDDAEYKKLSYGRVMIITDADVDGIHISGLLQNMFHFLFPTLFDRESPFLFSMLTPIVRVFLSKTSLTFYDERKYAEYAQEFAVKNPSKKINLKYYKGLGSTTGADEIADTFGKKIVEFVKDDHADANMFKLFHKTQADARKKWLTQYNPNDGGIEWDGDEVMTQLNISDFINHELIKYSIDDCGRSIPSVMDGNKESHRKVLYTAFLVNLSYKGKELKTAQFAADVAKNSGYHHGEVNLNDTITKMANDYVGSNNIPLLFRGGQFGSRLSGGKDAANARYTYTKLDLLTRLIYRADDDSLLPRNKDDGDIVEPKFYVPIIPMVLVNGCTCGIGTGWSSNIPCYNPLDLVKSIKEWLHRDKSVDFSVDLTPWTRGFTGTIEVDGKVKTKHAEKDFISWGKIEDGSRGTKVVTELPVGMWTDKFRDTLDGFLEEKTIKGYKDNSTAELVHFTITEAVGDKCIKADLAGLKLYTNIKTTNMVLFDENQCIKKFNTIGEIIDNFCHVRYEYYEKRKKALADDKKASLKLLGNKKRFLDEILSGELKLSSGGAKPKSRPIASIIEELDERGYDKVMGKGKTEDEEDVSEAGGYEYLLRIQFGSITTERATKLKNEILSETKQLEGILAKSETEMWINELDEFVEAYEKWIGVKVGRVKK